MPPRLVTRMRRSGSAGAGRRGLGGRGRGRGLRDLRPGQGHESRPALWRPVQEALAGWCIPWATLVVGEVGTQAGAAIGRQDEAERGGRRRGAAQLAHLVEQLPDASDFTGRGGEELREATVRFQVTAHHDRVVRLERLGHAVHQLPAGSPAPWPPRAPPSGPGR